MSPRSPAVPGPHRDFPQILPMRERANVINGILEKRLATILSQAMRETGLDMWLILCQEDDLDPVFTTLIPMDTWCPILQMLVFYDRGGDEGVERINLCRTNTHGLYDAPDGAKRLMAEAGINTACAPSAGMANTVCAGWTV